MVREKVFKRVRIKLTNVSTNRLASWKLGRNNNKEQRRRPAVLRA